MKNLILILLAAVLISVSALAQDGVTEVSSNKAKSQEVNPATIARCMGEGDTYFPGENKQCCPGLSHRWNYEIQKDVSCAAINKPSPLGHQQICIKCGDDVCGQGENGCNCPQDCKDYKCTGHGEIPRYTDFYDDMSIQCCKGLAHRTQKEYFKDDCSLDVVDGYTGICLACGDGRCEEKYESKCNCPEDCQSAQPKNKRLPGAKKEDGQGY